MYSREIPAPGLEGQEGDKREKLLLPKAIDVDIKRRLSLDGILELIPPLDPVRLAQGEIDWRTVIQERYPTHWTDVEANYLLYGKSTPLGIVSIGFYFQYYNFFHTVNMDDPQEAKTEGICKSDQAIWPHTHTYLDNPERNRNNGRFLGTLHTHPFSFGNSGSADFSPQDLAWNQAYLRRYGTDGRKMTFVIYNQAFGKSPENDYYSGVSQTITTPPVLLDISLA